MTDNAKKPTFLGTVGLNLALFFLAVAFSQGYVEATRPPSDVFMYICPPPLFEWRSLPFNAITFFLFPFVVGLWRRSRWAGWAALLGIAPWIRDVPEDLLFTIDWLGKTDAIEIVFDQVLLHASFLLIAALCPFLGGSLGETVRDRRLGRNEAPATGMR